MLKKKFLRFLPDRNQLKSNKSLRFLGDKLFDINLWHINRRSVAKAFLVGIFSAFIPMPMQMALAAFLAISVHANIPISVALVWITNPFTMPFVFYFTYKVGCFFLDISPGNSKFTFSWEWISTKLSMIWLPLYLGSVICGIIASIASYFLIRLFWRVRIVHNWKKRQLLRKNSNTKA